MTSTYIYHAPAEEVGEATTLIPDRCEHGVKLVYYREGWLLDCLECTGTARITMRELRLDLSRLL